MKVSNYNTIKNARINAWRCQVTTQGKMLKEAMHEGIKFKCDGKWLNNLFTKISSSHAMANDIEAMQILEKYSR